MYKKFLLLIFSLGVSLSAGWIGSLFTISQIPTWYADIEKPVFNPPNFVFGPVWTVLYILMGVSLYLLLTTKSDKKAKKKAIIFFVIQLVLNTFWSIIFFGLHAVGVAFLEILVLWGAILATILYTRRITKNGAYLLYPYLAWVSFATLLNFSIYLLNS
jgi:tryptophan-rich sensory protein